MFGGIRVADTQEALRVFETSHAPTQYNPRRDISPGVLTSNARRTICECNGQVVYCNVVANDAVAPAAAWTYIDPIPAFELLSANVAFYAEPMDACYAGDEQVNPQPGNFYGGWVTSYLAGPIKGATGTMHW